MTTFRKTLSKTAISASMLNYLRTGDDDGDILCFICYGLPEVKNALAAAKAAHPGEAFPWAEKEVRRLKRFEGRSKAGG